MKQTSLLIHFLLENIDSELFKKKMILFKNSPYFLKFQEYVKYKKLFPNQRQLKVIFFISTELHPRLDSIDPSHLQEYPLQHSWDEAFLSSNSGQKSV